MAHSSGRGRRQEQGKVQQLVCAKVGLVKQSIEDSKMAWTVELELEKFETGFGKK